MKRKGWVPASVHSGNAMNQLREIEEKYSRSEILSWECHHSCLNKMTATVFKRDPNFFKCAKCGAWWKITWFDQFGWEIKRINDDEARTNS